MAKYEIEFPPLMLNGVEFEPTGEFRRAQPGEVVLGDCCIWVNCNTYETNCRYIILRRKQTPLDKLEALCRRIIDGNDAALNAELDACIAAVKGVQ